MPEYCRRLSGASCFSRVSTTAWASWQFREFVFHVTKNVNTASREEGNLYMPAVPWALARRRRQVRPRLFLSYRAVQLPHTVTDEPRGAEQLRTEPFVELSRGHPKQSGWQGQAKPLTRAQSGCWCAPRAAP